VIPELRPPRRATRRERDLLPSILVLVLILGVGAYLGLRKLAPPEELAVDVESPPAASVGGGRVPAPAPNAVPTPEPLPDGTRFDCGLINGERRCVPRSAAADESGPSAAERVQRALDIMREQPASPPSRADKPARYPSVDGLLATAERDCRLVQAEGSIAYRQCRARWWQHFRDHCIGWRGRLNLAGAAQYDAVRSQTDAFCGAEQRYRIIE
jgi:hypothetical protein